MLGPTTPCSSICLRLNAVFNAVRYLDYVNGLCEGMAMKAPACVAKDPITLPDGKTMS